MNKLFLVMLFLIAGLAVGCQESTLEAAVVGPAPGAACTVCHKGERSFSSRDAEDLAEAIRAIRDGKMKHPPLRLSDQSDAAIAALAAELTK